jgi:hypothetical protein
MRIVHLCVYLFVYLIICLFVSVFAYLIDGGKMGIVCYSELVFKYTLLLTRIHLI